MIRRGPLLLIATLLALHPAVALAGATSRPTLRLSLRIRVARCDGAPVRSRAWLDGHLAAARAIYKPHGIELAARFDTFAPQRCELLHRAHRDRYARFVDSDEITVLVTRRVRDLDVEDYNLMGVHWRCPASRCRPARRWVLLTGRARPPVLAHELAHYLGLRHDPRGGNLMTPGPSDPAWKKPPDQRPRPFASRFSPEQARRLRRLVRRLARD
jgi:hypothetical protein